MRFADRRTIALFFLIPSVSLPAQPLSPVHQQRYAMGTMFDIVVYHGSTRDAMRAVDQAMDEISRLDRVMSHFRPDSEVARLVRDARQAFVAVDPSLVEVIQESILVSRRSTGKFDVTIGPLVKMWKAANSTGRMPSAAEVSDARRCVGYDKIEIDDRARIRVRSDCMEIDLGGIGKGYAVDRAMAVLRSAGIRRAVINAGGSSIAAMGSPPGEDGWPVRVGSVSGTELRLHDNAISTSEQNGEIVDPHTAAPALSRSMVTVAAPRAALADALSTTLVMMSVDDGAKLLEQFAGVSVLHRSHAR
jgi:thiamine biosynthesis lipoprotein